MTRFARHVTAAIVGVWIAGTPAAAQNAPFFFNQASPPEPVVKDAPYSAEGITTVRLTMYDGTKIERTVTARIYRDTAGRVRREQTVVGLEALDVSADVRAVVIIMDPVADAIYTLIPGSRTAQKIPWSVLRNEKTPAAATAWPTRDEALGAKDLDGIAAVGTRTITTIPAGKVGNDRPIEIIDERWESPALKVLLRSLHRDPRTGDVEYVLTKISRAEPPASMFTVPAGYTIKLPAEGASTPAR
jgi:hypothetical protein